MRKEAADYAGGREERSKRAQELECDDETVERRGERRRVVR